MPMIANLDQIKAAADCRDIIARRVQLRQAGKNWVGRCPIHNSKNERSTSLQVFPERGWYCFGCQKGGGAIDFVMAADNVDFLSAAEIVAGEVGLRIEYAPRGSDPAGAQIGPTRQDLLDACDAACRWYERTLAETPAAIEYAAARGLGEAVRRRWRIGYARGNGVAECGTDVDVLVAAGVLRRPEKGGRELYDPLAGRLIVPLPDIAGRIVGFAGRAMPGNDSAAKYLNTGDTPLYRKSDLLYGYPQAKALVRENGRMPLVLEGQLKAMAAIEAGWPAVAPGGTGLAERQVKLLATLGEHVWLCYDRVKEDGAADTAGHAATLRAAAALRAEGITVSCARLLIPDGAPPGARDPDDLLAAGLPVEFAAVPYWQWCLDALATAPAGTPEWSRQIAAAVVPALRTWPEEAGAALYGELQALSAATGIPVRALEGSALLPYERRPGARPVDDPDPQTWTRGRYLCALCLQAEIVPDDPNWWEATVRWTCLPADLVQWLAAVARVRWRAQRRNLSISAAVEDMPGLADAQRRYLRHWATCPLPGPAGTDAISSVQDRLARNEQARWVQEELV